MLYAQLSAGSLDFTAHFPAQCDRQTMALQYFHKILYSFMTGPV